MAIPLVQFTITPKTVIIFLHLIGAATWIGALALYILVVRPSASSNTIEATRKTIEASKKLSTLIWAGLIVLLVTGTWNTIDNPVSVSMGVGLVSSFEELERLGDTAFGSALRIKHGFFILLVALMAYRSYKLLPELERLIEKGEPEKAKAVEKQLEQTNKIILLVGYGILLFAAIIVFSLR